MFLSSFWNFARLPFRPAWLRRGLGMLLLALLFLAVPQAVRADGSDTVIDCDIPLDVVCTVTDPDGISLVQVEIPTGLGDIMVVDETFSCETEVEVSWDPIVPGYEFFVDDCDSPTPPGLQIVYGGASHQPLGVATLALSEQRLIVGNIGTTGQDGALINLRPYSFWEGHFMGLDLRNTSDFGFLQMDLSGQVEGGGCSRCC